MIRLPVDSMFGPRQRLPIAGRFLLFMLVIGGLSPCAFASNEPCDAQAVWSSSAVREILENQWDGDDAFLSTTSDSSTLLLSISRLSPELVEVRIDLLRAGCEARSIELIIFDEPPAGAAETTPSIDEVDEWEEDDMS